MQREEIFRAPQPCKISEALFRPDGKERKQPD